MSPELTGGFVTGRIAGEDSVARLLLELRRVGVPRARTEVLSDLPLPEGVLGGEMADTRVPWFTALGLTGGLALGLFLSVGTLLLYPLMVGSQAVISPPVFIIIYEVTMAGIVVLTAGGLIYENRVRRDVARTYGLRSLPGEAVFVVRVPPDVVPDRVERAMREVGAEDVVFTPIRPAELGGRG
ncbi:MAG: hypothetical protein Kow00129_03890 [Thermoleophilia bacterium]